MFEYNDANFVQSCIFCHRFFLFFFFITRRIWVWTNFIEFPLYKQTIVLINFTVRSITYSSIFCIECYNRITQACWSIYFNLFFAFGNSLYLPNDYLPSAIRISLNLRRSFANIKLPKQSWNRALVRRLCPAMPLHQPVI